MANLNHFNANEVEPTAAFEPLPAGKYLAAITASEMKATKKGDGSYLQLEFTVLDGDPSLPSGSAGASCRGRKVWDRLCINHPNDLTQKIARGSLSAICRAVGVMQPGDSVELHNLPLVISVKLKKREDTGELTNEVKGYEPKASAAPSQATSAGACPGEAERSRDTTPPWKR